MKLISKRLSTLMVGIGIAVLPCSSFETSIQKGLPGIADKVQMVVDTMCGPMAFLMSCAGLLIAAGIWKFSGHSAGMKFASGAIAGMIVIANLVGWVGYFTGAAL